MVVIRVYNMNKNFMIASLSAMLVVIGILTFLVGGAGDERLDEAHILLDNANGKIEALKKEIELAPRYKDGYFDCRMERDILLRNYRNLYNMYKGAQE